MQIKTNKYILRHYYYNVIADFLRQQKKNMSEKRYVHKFF